MAKMTTENPGPEELDTELIHIIVQVPKDTIAVSVDAKLWQDGKLVDAHMDMTPEEFRQARQDFLDNVEAGDEYDGIYTITEEGEAFLERLKRGLADGFGDENQ